MLDFSSTIIYNKFMELKKSEVIYHMGSKLGRPLSSNPKNNDIKVRLDDDTHNKLLEYCKRNGITKAEAIRQGITKILENKKS